MTEGTGAKSTACNLCFVNCGIKVELGGDDGRQFVKIKGDPEHPTSQGYICNKAARLNYYQNAPDRLTSPMRRKADGSYEAIDWDTAIREIADKLATVKSTYGGEKIFYYGGGGQGNHLVGASAVGFKGALGIKYSGSALSQEKTGFSWVYSRMIGGLIHPELHHAQVAMLVGKNPFLSNGMDQARSFLRDIKKDPNRKLIVVDPRVSESTDYADIHLAVTAGRDAWLMAAIVGHIVQSELLPMDWLQTHANGYDEIIEYFKTVPVEEYARFSGVDPELAKEAAEVIGNAETFALEEDIGAQMAPHSTLTSYLNFLTMLITGNYGRPGTMGMITQLGQFLPTHLGKVDDDNREVDLPRLPVTGFPIISGLYPGALLAEEILNDHPDRPRALIVESSNPVHSLPETPKLRKAIRSLDFSLAVDVVMTDTARECDYVLPVATQYEKWEATFFPRNFPANIFHMRKPLLAPLHDLPTEHEIHSRIIEAMGLFEEGELDDLKQAASEGFDAYQGAFFQAFGSNPKVGQMISHVLYRTLGEHLPEGQSETAVMWGLSQIYVMKHPQEAARAGFKGPDAGTQLFNALRTSPSGAIIGISSYDEAFSRIPHPDNKLQLVIRELMDEMDVLRELKPLLEPSEEFPFALTAGARRSYTANCIMRDPQWPKGKHITALTIHPSDAEALNLEDGAMVKLETEVGSALVDLGYDERMQPGTLSIPNGQGMTFVDAEGEEHVMGVFANELTSAKYRDPFAGTPFHKHVPARVLPA